MDKVAFVNKISTLMKATSDEANPIQGYLYQEVNKIAGESESCCESTLEFLVDRLNKQSCHVKFKVLKLMKYIVENGPAQFKMGLIRNSHGIRDATKFSAPDDPLHGNVPNKAVRKMAQELSQLLFNTEDKQVMKTSELREQDKSRITGIGSSNISKRGSLQGFGNSPTKTKSSFMDKLSRFASGFQDKTKEQQAEILSSIESCGDYRPPCLPLSFTSSQGPVEREINQGETIQHTPGKAGGGWGNKDDDGIKPVQHSPGKAAGGWDDEEDNETTHVPGKAGGGWDDEEESEDVGKQTSSISSQDGIKNLDGVETTGDWKEEENLIESALCKSENLSMKDIRNFISDCNNLSCEKVIDLLNSHLKSSSQSSVMKSLLLIEYLSLTGLVSCDFICKTCQQQLLVLSTEGSLESSNKARKILLCFEKLLGTRLFVIEGQMDNTQLMLIED